jgi:bifunctional non-homologous end joining protein LigD
MSLTEYKKKRRFNRTPEPRGKRAAKGGRLFVIQKHRASHLHYDFRLELDGVLKSWAVPKGPSLDPSVKRLAMHVEDHPVEYGAFEGVIPEGEYGGGTVMLWDRGQWEPVGDPREGYETGRFKFKLHGQKLRGGWMLVRTGEGSQYVEPRKWLLFKERDAEALPATKSDVVQDMPLSVASGRDLDEIAAARDRVWGSKNGRKRPGQSRLKEPGANGKRVSPHRPGRSKTAAPKSSGRKETVLKIQDKTLRSVRLTSPDKVLYPEQGITKLELASYFNTVAEWMLPHVENRPLVLVRCPEGRQSECFYQKHPGYGTPDTLRQIDVRESKKTKKYLVALDTPGLVSLAQIGALEIHAWGSRADRLEHPDRLIFDLDPAPDVPWSAVVQGARQVRQFLEELGLQAFVKTTGGKGLHLVVPIDRRHDWDEAKAFCKSVAELVVRAEPKRYTANMAKAARHGKIFIDYLRNGRGATAIVPYSTRARPGAPVSAPLSWDELGPDTTSDRYTVRNLARRLASLKHDPWRGIESVRQSLAGPLKEVRTLSVV